VSDQLSGIRVPRGRIGLGVVPDERRKGSYLESFPATTDLPCGLVIVPPGLLPDGSLGTVMGVVAADDPRRLTWQRYDVVPYLRRGVIWIPWRFTPITNVVQPRVVVTGEHRGELTLDPNSPLLPKARLMPLQVGFDGLALLELNL
jgi:hypothetical protein